MAKSFARHWLTLAAGAAAVWLGLVLVAVPALIRAAYQQRAGVFNRLIGGRTTHPLSFYLDAWSRLALVASSGQRPSRLEIDPLLPRRSRSRSKSL